MALTPLVIIGAGGFGREVAWLVREINRACPTWELLGFVESRPELQGQTVGGYAVLGGNECLEELVSKHGTDLHAVLAIGTSSTRRKIVRSLTYLNLKYATLVHPSVLMEKDGGMAVRVGAGSIICANNILTVDVRIGEHVIINLACTVGHDAVVGDFGTLLPTANISGNSVLGEGVLIGTGSQILEGRTIGEGTIVGAGSVVVKDLPPNCTAVGAPAKPMKTHDQPWNQGSERVTS